MIGMSLMLRRFGLGFVAAAAFLTAAVGLLLAGSIGTASASVTGYSVSSPASGLVVSGATGGVVPISIACPLNLCLPGASSAEHATLVDPYGTTGCDAVAIPLTQGASTLTGSFNAENPYPTGCGPLAGLPGYDGTWTLKLTGTTTASQPLTFQIPPVTPSAPTLSPTNGGIVLTWPGNSEPDADATIVTLDPDSTSPQQGKVSCPSGTPTCSTGITATPGKHTVEIAAVRTVGPKGSDLASSNSPPATVTVPDPPASAAASSGAAGSAAAGKSGSTGTTTTGGGKAAATTAPKTGTLPSASSHTFSTFAAGVPEGLSPALLPSLDPATIPTTSAAPTIPTEGVNGPYSSTLDYGSAAPTLVPQISDTAAGRNASSDPAVASREFWICLAGALLLVLTAFHVRVWSKALAPETPTADDTH